MIGRPSKFSQKLIDLICRRIADGESLRKICLDDKMPSRNTVRVWLLNNQSFQVQYARAHEDQADVYAEGVIDISDAPLSMTYPDGNPIPKTDMLAHMRLQMEQRRLQIDARKWAAGKGRPKKYGDIKAVEAEDTDIHIHGGLPEPSKE